MNDETYHVWRIEFLHKKRVLGDEYVDVVSTGMFEAISIACRVRSLAGYDGSLWELRKVERGIRVHT